MAQPRGSLLQKRILIVEDRQFDAAHLARELETRGMEAVCATRLDDALALARGAQFDLVILDLNLPDSDAAETLAAAPKFGEIPIIIVTAEESRGLIDLVTAAGYGLEFKPVNVPNLVSTALKRMNRQRPSVELANALVEEHHRQSAPTPPGPWFLRWVPALSFAVALMTASCMGGAFLYRKVAEKAAQATENEARFKTVDAVLLAHSEQMKAHADDMNRLHAGHDALERKAQSSSEDRAVLHRDLETLTRSSEKSVRELKEDIVSRLNRIEDKLDRKIAK